MRILLAGATGAIGRQAVPILAAAGHEVTGLAHRPARLPDAEVVAADALDPAAVAAAVRSAAPDVIVHMLTAVPDPIDPRHLARDMPRPTSCAPRARPTCSPPPRVSGSSPRGSPTPTTPPGPQSRTSTRPCGTTRRPSSPPWWLRRRSRRAG
jgi:uncharacterized protein YbjT (DUF2867 family)